jgi:[protein-PII] uridylyltransferase
VKSLHELVRKGVITESAEREVLASQDFLFRVRNALHFATGAHQDRLSFEFQDAIAGELGFGEAGSREALVAFMRTYYAHATTIQRFSNAIVERCTERSRPYRMIGRVTGREIRDGVRVFNRTLSVKGPEVLRADPTNLITLFREAQRHGVPMSESTKGLIREHLSLIGETERSDPAYTRPFLDVLAWKHDVWETVREMHAVGVLCQLFPEFSRIDRLVQRDLYHTFTVDEHSLMGIAELERLRRGDYKASAPLLTEVMRDVDRHDVLFLAMLFHDIGKGHGEGHSERGAELVKGIMRRLPINEDDAAQWEFLVRHHLLMSHLAQHRDTHDPGLVRELARTVGDVENLKSLYVMTFADMRAVAPKVWNNWRDVLLGELYMQTRALFEQGRLEEDHAARAERMRRRVRATIDPARRAAFDAFLASMPERYLTGTPEARIPAHFELMSHLREEWSVRPVAEHPYIFVSDLQHFPESEHSEFSICTPDRPGLFSMVAGVVAAQGMSILAAQITTSRGGIALDTFRIGHLDQRERVLDDDRWDRVKGLLAQVLRGQVDVAELVKASRRPSILEKQPRARVETRVVADNSIAEDYTVLDVITGDRVGVLFAITHCLHRLGLVIHFAKITTQVHQVFDVFYVTDADGAKIADEARLEHVRATLVEELEELAAPRDGTT